MGLGVAARIPRVRLEPVARPFGHVACHVHRAVGAGPVGEAAHNGRAPVARLLGVGLARSPFVPPGVDERLGAPSRLLPLRFGGQSLPRPLAEGLGIIPAHLHHGMVGLALGVVLPGHGIARLFGVGHVARLPHEVRELLVGYLEHVHLEGIHRDRVRGSLNLMVAPHGELPGGNGNHRNLHDLLHNLLSGCWLSRCFLSGRFLSRCFLTGRFGRLGRGCGRGSWTGGGRWRRRYRRVGGEDLHHSGHGLRGFHRGFRLRRGSRSPFAAYGQGQEGDQQDQRHSFHCESPCHGFCLMPLKGTNHLVYYSIEFAFCEVCLAISQAFSK